MRAPFSTNPRFYFIGIGGIGMSALARILLEKKKWVSGSDRGSPATVAELRKMGAVIFDYHSARNISPHDIVVFSSAVTPSNPEYQAAVELKCKMLHRSELLAQMMEEHNAIAVAGTHGKTTTTSLLTAVFLESKLDPTYAIGGLLQGLNGKEGKGGYFLFEADESDGSFLNYFPEHAIITSLEPEHMDHYGTEEELRQSYATFLSQVCSHLIYCGDDARLTQLKPQGKSYGFSSTCDWQLTNFCQKGWHLFFDLGEFKAIEVALTGRHNALNAAAVFILAHTLGIREENIRAALKHFPGIKRRCEKKGSENGILRIDDYAHHPTEIHASLKGIKEAAGARRVVTLFQPHRYCRTQQHLEEFGKAFEWADLVYITDIFAAREKPIEGLSAHSVIEQIEKQSTVPCHYVSRKDCIKIMEEVLRPHDIFVTMGAGDITAVQQPFKPKKWKVGVVSGGRSPEHEISVRSGRFVTEALNPNFYEITSFHIHRSGEWTTGDLTAPLHKIMDKIDECELFLPILHGLHGEDGTIQGFFETLQKAYIGSDHLCAALCTNKVLSKQLAQRAGVPTPPFTHFHHFHWLQGKEECLNHALQYPVYVKPVNLGSSIGISQVKCAEELEAAIELAFRFDTHIMIEEGKMACREFEFAVVGGEGFEISVPRPGEKIAQGEFVDYEKKYGEGAISTSVEPTLSKKTLEQGKEYAKKAYLAMQCSGFTRVDFLLDPQEKWWFFELNAIPGMQPRSLFPKIWKRDGVDPTQLMDRFITLALARQNMQKRHR